MTSGDRFILGIQVSESGHREPAQDQIRSDFTDMTPICSHIYITLQTHREQSGQKLLTILFLMWLLMCSHEVIPKLSPQS